MSNPIKVILIALTILGATLGSSSASASPQVSCHLTELDPATGMYWETDVTTSGMTVLGLYLQASLNTFGDGSFELVVNDEGHRFTSSFDRKYFEKANATSSCDVQK